MAWTISNAMMKDYENSLSLQEQEEASSEVICSDGKLSAQLNITPMPDQYYWPDKTTEHSRLSQFGMTCEPLTAGHGKDILTWFLEDSLAKISQSPELELASLAREVDYGQNKNASFAKWTHSTQSWKTAQHSLFEDLELSLETWPKWGFLHDGECFHAQMSAEFIYEKEFGLLLPTSCASDTSARKLPPRVHICKSGLPKHVNAAGVKSQMRLSQALRLPTLGANEGKGSSKKRFIGSPDFHGAKMSEGLRICETDPIYLNPLFGELVMMWPLGWTDLRPLATDKFQEWQLQHGRYSANERN